MRVVYKDHVDIIDFVVPTVEMARELIKAGAQNREELLLEAGLSEREVKRELWRLLPGYIVIPEVPDPEDGES